MQMHPETLRPFLFYTYGSAKNQVGQRVDFGSGPHTSLTDFVVGAVLITPRDELFYTWTEVPDAVVADWLPRKQQIGQVELFGALFAQEQHFRRPEPHKFFPT